MLAKQKEQRRFFYHFHKQTKGMTVHFNGACWPVWDVKCLVPCETKRNSRQPYLVMRGWARDVEIKVRARFGGGIEKVAVIR